MDNHQEITKPGKSARAAYIRQWRRDHPERCKAYAAKYWNKKATENQNDDMKGDHDKK